MSPYVYVRLGVWNGVAWVQMSVARVWLGVARCGSGVGRMDTKKNTSAKMYQHELKWRAFGLACEKVGGVPIDDSNHMDSCTHTLYMRSAPRAAPLVSSCGLLHPRPALQIVIEGITSGLYAMNKEVCWLAGCWLLAAGCRLLAAGCRTSAALTGRFSLWLPRLDCSRPSFHLARARDVNRRLKLATSRPR